MTEDSALITRAQNGDKEAFRLLVESHAQRLYALAYDLTANRLDAEDLVQEVFIKVYRYLASFRGNAKFSTWLHKITVNTWLNIRKSKYYQSRQNERTLEEKEHNMIRTNSDPATNVHEHISLALNRLSERERSAFVLRHYHDMPLREIGSALKITTGTVKSLLFRSVKKLQKQLEPYRQELEA